MAMLNRFLDFLFVLFFAALIIWLSCELGFIGFLIGMGYIFVSIIAMFVITAGIHILIYGWDDFVKEFKNEQ